MEKKKRPQVIMEELSPEVTAQPFFAPEPDIGSTQMIDFIPKSSGSANDDRGGAIGDTQFLDTITDFDSRNCEADDEHNDKFSDDSDAPDDDTDSEGEQLSEKRKRVLKKRLRSRRERTRTFSHILGSLFLVALIIISSAFAANFIIRAFLDFTGINVVEFSTLIDIAPEATMEEIAEILYAHQIIAMPQLFTLYARLSEKDSGYLSGEFLFASNMSYSQLILTMQVRPRSTETVMITIPEGTTAREIGELLEAYQVCRAEDFTRLYRERLDVFDFETRLAFNPLKLNQMEGFLFPETYEFFVVNGLDEDPDMDTTAYARVILRTLLFQFNDNMTPHIYRSIADLGDSLGLSDDEFGLNGFVTLASLVQWEAATPEDMQTVASVFINRMRRGGEFSLLQSDVTRRYGRESLLPYHTPTTADRIDELITAFDTYSTPGLPPGPVNNPGMTAMLAVLDAPKTDYYYFCANIETGQKFYARTLAEHQANLRTAGLIDTQGNQIFGN
ncbi:MAG: endolytic transglycosylase MltG [Oscillospiraceae bacterium]|nr:endolytic transglycosylase MltG [Oscillospiraceae bacterium]